MAWWQAKHADLILSYGVAGFKTDSGELVTDDRALFYNGANGRSMRNLYPLYYEAAYRQLLEKHGVPTHFVKELNDREALVKKVSIVPLEVIIRNVSAGSFAKRYGVEEGIVFKSPTIEFSYKNDDLHDPLLNEYHALALNLATREEIDEIKAMAFKVNDILKEYFLSLNVKLIDFKLEFGRLADGKIVLADEISPDTCRFWDAQTNEKLDKDRFRRDMGGVEDAYKEMMKRVFG